MLSPSLSLRARLMVLLLIPLTVISALAGYWRISTAAETSRDVFDRTLVALTLAISRDVIASGGDALSATTAGMIRNAVGGTLFYHVYGPDGAFVTGYATPPVAPPGVDIKENEPYLFASKYRGQQVRVARLLEHSSVDGINGYSSVTVWQPTREREKFVRSQAIRAIALIASLYLTVAAVIWFGVNLGLKPLTGLRNAIARRSSDDLSTIKRPVPPEVQDVVQTLNDLFQQVGRAIDSRDRFISDAAHQLRNPVAGLLSLAEAARDAKSTKDRRLRVQEIVIAAHHASHLTNQLLSLERAKGQIDRSRFELLDLNDIARKVCERNGAHILGLGLEFSFHPTETPLIAEIDELLVQEALQNLIDNALYHGGPDNEFIKITVTSNDSNAVISVSDAGIGIKKKDRETAFSRFGQLAPGQGSGLGLAIVEEIIAHHGGKATIEPSLKGTCVSLSFPRVS